MSNIIKIGKELIGEKYKPYFIADIAANHDGDLNRAFKLIELAKEAGADCAKFQNFKAEKIVSKEAFEKLERKVSHQSSWNKSVFEVYKDASIPENWTARLKEKCDEIGIEYMTSPYDFESIDMVDKYVNAYKVGSGDITWIEILEYMAKKNKPLLLATGASTLEDVKRAVESVIEINNDLILMQCNTNYTASVENFKYINLNVLKTYKELFPNAILGLSDHTLGHSTVLGAITLGARVIEKHFTDDNSRIGPDHKFSMNPKTWAEMINASEELFYSLGDGIKRVEENELETVILQRRAFYFSKNLVEGHIISEDDIEVLRPAKEEGVWPYHKHKLIGNKIRKSVKKGDLIKLEDIDID